MSGSGREPFRMSGTGRETLPDVQESLLDVRECSEGPPGCPTVVESLSQNSGSGWEGLPDVWEWSEVPTGSLRSPLGCPEVVGRPSQMTGIGRKVLMDVREAFLVVW